MVQPVTGNNTCDTADVSYSRQVQPIIRDNCYACHATAVTASGGLDLENFASFKSYLMLYFQADGVYGSKFMHIVAQQGTVLYMPPTGKLSDCEIAVIRNWISKGAIQN
ncbi:hypothetical protein ACTHGU_13710 [Chitinophagaceae bacterium MMS25-I14]